MCTPFWSSSTHTQQWHIDLQKSLGFFRKCKCHCWVGRMIDSLFYSGRKLSPKCENSFVNYGIHHQRLCYLMRQIAIDMNWPSVHTNIYVINHLFKSKALSKIFVPNKTYLQWVLMFYLAWCQFSHRSQYMSVAKKLETSGQFVLLTANNLALLLSYERSKQIQI